MRCFSADRRFLNGRIISATSKNDDINQTKKRREFSPAFLFLEYKQKNGEPFGSPDFKLLELLGN